MCNITDFRKHVSWAKLSLFCNTEVWSEMTIILTMTHERSDVLRKSRRPIRIRKRKQPHVCTGVAKKNYHVRPTKVAFSGRNRFFKETKQHHRNKSKFTGRVPNFKFINFHVHELFLGITSVCHLRMAVIEVKKREKGNGSETYQRIHPAGRHKLSGQFFFSQYNLVYFELKCP